MEKILKLYTYVDGTNDTPFPSSDEQIIIGSFTYTANRMGSSPAISATVKHRLCLDNLWNDKVYAEFNGEKYFVINTPSSSKSNDDTRYEHELELLSEREVLNHVYFIDAVQGDSDVDQYKSNSTKVQFYGNLEQFVGRLNASLSYRNLGYSAVIDDGITSEDKQVSFEDKYILEALQEIFNIYELPYYFVGKTIHIGFTTNTITTPLKYGYSDALLSISKDNANYALINRITGAGSSDNIPYYYPNNSPKGDLGIKIISGNMVKSNFIITDYDKFSNSMSLTDVCKCTSVSDGGITSFKWSIGDNDILLSDIGIKLAENAMPQNGASFGQEVLSYITPSQNLMPPIYRESGGAERFYNAKNNTYPDGEGGYYQFENEYSESNPREGITDFEEIKPTIVGVTNSAGHQIDSFIDFAYDTNDNDEVDENGEYLHPYFFAKLRKTDGSYGFNLFDQAIENQAMQISFTSGVCGACTFEIAVGDETQKNLVQVGDSGALMRDENGNVLCGRKDLQQPQTPQDRQNDTQKYEVWIALRKDSTTYPQVMPNVNYSYKPSTSDTFVILGINLPQAYILKAEDELEKSLIKYMWMNNVEKFTFSAKFSRIFFTENPDVLAELNENARIIIEYNNRQHTLYISNYSYKMDSGSPLPEIDIDLVDTLTIGKNSLQTAIDSVKQDILSSIGGGDFLAQGLKYFLRKDKEDSTRYLLRMLGGAHFFPFTQGMIGGSGAAFYKNAAGKTYMEADGAYLRDELIVPKITFNCIDVISGDKANTFAFGTIKSVDTDNKTAELDLLEDQTGTLHVDDICRGVFHNLDGGNQQDDMEDGNGFYGYAGFSTSYFTPTEIITNEPGEMVFRYSLQAGTSVHPMKGMNFFAYGNFTDKTRQSITYETRYYTRRLKDVNTWVINPTKNISMQDGLLEGLTIGGMVMHGYGTFQENCYFTGVNIQFTPDTEEALKGQDAYSVSLSSYERVVKMDEYGNIVSLLEALNVVTGDENVTTGDKNVITTQKRIQTHIQAFKGSTELLYSDTMDAGVYKVTLSPQGCTASVEGGIVSIDSITATENCFVDIQVNCEGNAVFDKRFSVSIIRDGSDAYIVDLDNEMSSVACNAEGDIVAGLPVTSGVAFYKGTKALAISKMVTEAPAGVTCSVDEETHSVTVSAIGKEVAESFGITVTVTADDDGVPVTRSTVMTILKVKAGENATLYRLAPSVNIVKIDKEGNYSETYLSCGVNKVNGKGVSSLSTLPEGIEMTVKKDGLSESGYSLNDDIPIEGISKSITFRLKQEGVLIDTETIPFVADGTDGFTNIIADLDNEMASVACDTEGNVTAGLPIVSTIALYYGTEKIPLDSLTVEEPAGVTAKADKSTGKVTISSIASYTPDAVSVPVTCSGSFGGQSYGRTAYIKINKVKPGTNGENAVIYSLVVEPSAIKVDKSGTLSSSSVSCKVKKTDGNSSSVVSSLPSGYTLRGYVDGDYTQTYSNASATVTVSKEWQSVGFRLMDGTTVIDEETIPIVKDGADGFGSVILDLDNEMASVACDTEGNVTAGLPVVINFDMFFGTEEMDITSISNPNLSGVSVSNSVSAKTSTITSIGSGTPESIEIEYTVKGTYSGTSYERKAVFRILKVTTGENGKDAVIYQLSPSVNVVKVNKNGSYIDSTIKCTLTKNDGGDVSSVSSLPSGFRMTIQRDSGSENTYTIGNNVSTTSASDKIAFRLYYGNVLADIETVPVVKDGTDGADGRPGSDGTDGKQGIQGCVIRTSIWADGREYRNDSDINDDSIIRYIDVAMTQDNTATGWRAYRCKKTHVSSNASGGITLFNTEYWEEFSENVSAIFTDLIIAKNAQLAFMQGNRIIIVDEDNGITAGISGYSDGIRFWAGAQIPDNAPFRVDYKGRVWATDGIFSGDLSARTMTLKRSTTGTSEAINGSLVAAYDKLGRFPEVSGDDVKVIEILHPRISRTQYSVTFMGVNSNVYFAPDNEWVDAVSSLSISNIQGCYFRCFGYNNGGKTYWSVIPMNDMARIELENA